MLSEKQISQAYSRISECKNELAQAKRIRKNRQGNILLQFRSSVLRLMLQIYSKLKVQYKLEDET